MSAPNPDRLPLLRELVIHRGRLIVPAVPPPPLAAVIAALTADGTISTAPLNAADQRATLVLPRLDAAPDHDRALIVTAMARVMLALESAPDRILAMDAAALDWSAEVDAEDSPSELRRVAVSELRALGVIERRDGLIRDVTGDRARAARGAVPVFPSAVAPVPPVDKVPPKPAPAPTSAPAPAELVDMPTTVTVDEEEPAPTPKPVAPPPVTAAKVEEPKPEPVAPTPTPVTPSVTVAPEPAAKPAANVIAEELRELREMMAALVGQGRLEPNADAVERRNRMTLVRRIVVLLAAHGGLTKSELTRTKLSNVQNAAVSDALEYALAVGAIQMGARRRYRLVDHSLVGLTAEAVKAEVEAIHHRAAEREAREANARIESHRDMVVAR